MNRPTDDDLLAFLTGGLDGPGREAVLTWVERSPEGAADLRAAARGLAGAEVLEREIRGAGEPRDPSPAALATKPRAKPPRTGFRSLRVPAWAVPLTAAATLALTIPFLSGRDARRTASATVDESAATEPGSEALRPTGAPVAPEPSFVLVLYGRWPDAASVGPDEQRRRAEEYWAWTSALARRGLLVAAGDLRWEPGLRVTGPGSWRTADEDTVTDPGFLVGMFALRTESYEEALAIARDSPHLSYGGSISVRRVGAGFVTVPGMSDWTD